MSFYSTMFCKYFAKSEDMGIARNNFAGEGGGAELFIEYVQSIKQNIKTNFNDA